MVLSRMSSLSTMGTITTNFRAGEFGQSHCAARLSQLPALCQLGLGDDGPLHIKLHASQVKEK